MSLTDLVDSLNDLRLQNTGCDVTIKIGSKSFPAHRMMLMGRMEYFRKMFTIDMKEKNESIVSLDPLIIDPTVFGDILDYVYTMKIAFTADNIQLLCKAVDFFCFDELKDKIIKYLEKSLKIENVVLYRTIASDFNLKSLETVCRQLIDANFSLSIVRKQLVPNLSLEDLNEMIERLNENEKFDDMLEYSIDWILHNNGDQSGVLLQLLNKIPCRSLSFDVLKRALENETIRENPECFEMLLNSFVSLSEFYAKKAELSKHNLYAIGGCHNVIQSTVSQYDHLNHEWIATTPMPLPKSHFGCAAMNQKIYICGGVSILQAKEKVVNHLTVFDTKTKTWNQLTPMNNRKELCAAAILNGKLYVAGGVWKEERYDIVERYCPETDEWENVCPMTTKRSSLELVAMNGFLYALGGYDGTEELNSVERYNPHTDQWTEIASMNNTYYAFGSAVLNDRIYVVGKNKCEVYCSADDQWTEMAAPFFCENGRRLAVYDDKLFVVGGRTDESDDWKGIKTVEVFDFQTGSWRQEMNMDVSRCYHGVAVA